MMGFSPCKKFFLSIFFALLIIVYVPVACLVGNDTDDRRNMALAETQAATEEESEEIIEFSSDDFQENV